MHLVCFPLSMRNIESLPHGRWIDNLRDNTEHACVFSEYHFRLYFDGYGQAVSLIKRGMQVSAVVGRRG